MGYFSAEAFWERIPSHISAATTTTLGDLPSALAIHSLPIERAAVGPIRPCHVALGGPRVGCGSSGGFGRHVAENFGGVDLAGEGRCAMLHRICLRGARLRIALHGAVRQKATYGFKQGQAVSEQRRVVEGGGRGPPS